MIWQGPSMQNHTRPHTAGGTTSGKSLQPFPESYHRTRRRGLTLRKSRSTTILPLSVPRDCEEVGLAIGSPSELVPRQTPAFAPPSIQQPHSIYQPLDALKATRAETEPTAKPARPTVKRWKTVSGLFTRKKSSPSSTPPPLTRVSEEANITPPRPSTSRPSNVSRTSSFFHRKSHAFTPPRTSEGRFPHKSQLVIPTLGDARAYEVGEEPFTPHLRVDIPQSSLGRYSVMFSSLLELQYTPQMQPRPASTVRDLATTYVKTPPQSEKPPSISARHRPDNPESTYPPRAESLQHPNPQTERLIEPTSLEQKPVPTEFEASHDAIDNAPWSARSSLCDLYAADEAEGVPAGVEAWALGCPSGSSHVESVTRRYSIDSYSTSIAPSPTSTSSTWNTETVTGEKQPTAALPTFSFPLPSPIDEDKPALQPELHLAVPSRPSRQSWDAGLPSPGFAPSGSPRMKFGYDTPHSPLISVATTVTVSMKSGQVHRPQMVMRDSHHSAHASYGRELEV